MSKNGMISVRVFGVPTTSGCDCGTNSATWREATEWVARSLKQRFGDQVRVEYFDLFLDGIEAYPEVLEIVWRDGAQPPLVFIGDDQGQLGDLFSSGRKISGPAIRKRLETMESAVAA